MALDFPASPTVGQTYTVSGRTWTWDGTSWNSSGTFVPPITVANGGTGATSITSGRLLRGNGTAAFTASLLSDDGTKLSAAAVIESTSGGFRFPDATTQTTAVPAAGWTQIAQIATTSGATATFSNIPQTYSEILFVFENVSHNSGTSTSFGIELSANGTNWSSRSSITAATGGSLNASGALHIPRYTGNSGSMVNGIGLGLTALAQTPSLSTSFVFAWAVAGIAHVRFSPGGGSFDAGTITLYGRN